MPKNQGEVSDTGWRQAEASQNGDMVRTITIPGPDANLPTKFRVRIFQCENNAPADRWRAHVSLNGSELFRIYATTLKKAQKQTKAELQTFCAAILAAFNQKPPPPPPRKDPPPPRKVGYV